MNSKYSQTIIVKDNQTAEYLGSGSLPIFSTPTMIALMENTAIQCLSDLPDGDSSVGIAIQVNHLKASRVGAMLQCTAEITACEGRRYSFVVSVTDEDGNLIGEGTHERVIVNVERFMNKV